MLQACVLELSLQKLPLLFVNSGSPLHEDVWSSVKCLERTVLTSLIVFDSSLLAAAKRSFDLK